MEMQTVRIWLTPEERDQIRSRANEAGLPCSEYCRRALNGNLMRGAPSEEIGRLLFVLQNLSNSLGHLLLRTEKEPLAVEIRAVLADVETLIELLLRIYGKKVC